MGCHRRALALPRFSHPQHHFLFGPENLVLWARSEIIGSAVIVV